RERCPRGVLADAGTPSRVRRSRPGPNASAEISPEGRGSGGSRGVLEGQTFRVEPFAPFPDLQAFALGVAGDVGRNLVIAPITNPLRHSPPTLPARNSSCCHRATVDGRSKP